MSRLQERLRLIRKEKPPRKEASTTEQSTLGEAWAAINATLVETEEGAFIRRTTRFPLDWIHGETPLGTLKEEASALSAICKENQIPALETMIFFDTETTGLGVGAGNLPFMLGFGYYEASQFVIEQCLLRNPADELAVLVYFQETLARFQFVVSYNGRSFDWPVLKNRYVMNRLSWDEDHLQQIDFLYPSRNLWKHILPNCSLGTVEADRLGYVRDEDVPGALAPTLYFQFIHSSEPEVLKGVFVHNERDILSLAGLAAHFAGVLCGRIPYLTMESSELLRLAIWLDRVGKATLANEVYNALLQRTEEDLAEIAGELAQALKRKKRMNEAVPLWKLVCHEWVSCVELAKYYEHQVKNLDKAMYYTEKAISLVRRRKTLTRNSKREQELLSQLEHRKRRLQAKQDKIKNDSQPYELYVQPLFD